MDDPQIAEWKFGMSRRVGIWLAIAAVLQQLLLPDLAAARGAAGTAAGVMEVCTSAGIIKIAVPGVPARPVEHAGQNHGKCLACCPGTGFAPPSGPSGTDFRPASDYATYASAGYQQDVTGAQWRAPKQRGPPMASRS